MDEQTNAPRSTLDLDPNDRVQVAHLFLKASSGDNVDVLTSKEAEAAIKRLFPDLFDAPPLARLAEELVGHVERDAGKAHYSENVRSTLELIRVELSVIAAAG